MDVEQLRLEVQRLEALVKEQANQAGLQMLLFLAATAIQHARNASLLALSEALANSAEIEELDGLPIQEWCKKVYIAALQGEMERTEDINPALAARLSDVIDKEQGKPGSA